MNFVYKIWSGYDGFTPRKIEDRMVARRTLRLGWARFIETVQRGAEVWVYFYGPGVRRSGVYAKGRVSAVDLDEHTVDIRLTDYSPDDPLTISATTERIAALLTRNRQVFPLPDDWDIGGDCTALESGESCRQRECELCPFWRGIGRAEGYFLPSRLSGYANDFAAGIWTIPARCYLGSTGVRADIKQGDQLFAAFKYGSEPLAYPLARKLYDELERLNLLDVGCIVPVPLSPDKEGRGEFHRTLALAKELAKLIGAPVRQALRLTQPISKRRFMNAGGSRSAFERTYRSYLETRGSVPDGKILIIDDTLTGGSTMRVCASELRRVFAREVVVATAGLMITKDVTPHNTRQLME